MNLNTHKIQPEELLFKNNKVLMSLIKRETDPILVEVLMTLVNVYGCIVTEGYRDQLHKNDLHGVIPVRAIDVRSWCYYTPQDVVDYLNSIWVYDPRRPHKKVAILHDTGRGKHIHLQSHPNTRRA